MRFIASRFIAHDLSCHGPPCHSPYERNAQLSLLRIRHVAFVTVLICSNLIGPAKIGQVESRSRRPTFGAGALFFPISYVFGDIHRGLRLCPRAQGVWPASRRWCSRPSCRGVVGWPPAPFWQQQVGLRDRVRLDLAASWGLDLCLFLRRVRQFLVLAKMKILTAGKWLWTRTIGSTIGGEAVDSALFYPLAFYGGGIIPDTSCRCDVRPVLAKVTGKSCSRPSLTRSWPG